MTPTQLSMELIKSTLIRWGGKLWEKNGNERVYLTNDVLEKMGFEVTEKVGGPGKKIMPLGKHKLWFDCKTQTLHSDKGLIRSALNGSGFQCSK